MVIPEFFYEDLIFERINRIEKLDNFFENLVLQEIKSKGTIHNISSLEICDNIKKKLTFKDYIRHRKDLEEFVGVVSMYGRYTMKDFFNCALYDATRKFMRDELKI